MQTLAVPYHLAEVIPDFDAGIPVDDKITVERPVPKARVVLVGARDIDREQRLVLNDSAVRLVPLDVQATDLPDGDLDLHIDIDIDICDPTDVPDLLFPAPPGPVLEEATAAVRRITATGRVIAVDLAATWHHNGPEALTQHAVMAHIGEAARVDMDDRAVVPGAGDGHVGTFNPHGLSHAFRVEP